MIRDLRAKLAEATEALATEHGRVADVGLLLAAAQRSLEEERDLSAQLSAEVDILRAHRTQSAPRSQSPVAEKANANSGSAALDQSPEEESIKETMTAATITPASVERAPEFAANDPSPKVEIRQIAEGAHPEVKPLTDEVATPQAIDAQSAEVTNAEPAVATKVENAAAVASTTDASQQEPDKTETASKSTAEAPTHDNKAQKFASSSTPAATLSVVDSQPATLAEPAVSAQANVSDPLAMGESIEARHGGGPKFFPGTVTAVHADDNTYDIAYADGDKESHVKRLRIRRAGEKQKRELAVGTVVEARYGGGQKLFDGVITASHGNDLFSISYADGDVETSVKRSFIEAQCAPKPSAVVAAAAAVVEKSQGSTAFAEPSTSRGADASGALFSTAEAPSAETIPAAEEPAVAAAVEVPEIVGEDSFGRPIDAQGGRVHTAAYYAARAEATQHATTMKREAASASALFESGDKSGARAASERKQASVLAMEAANANAVSALLDPQDWREKPCLDLHGLYVDEAEKATNSFLDVWEAKAAATVNENNSSSNKNKSTVYTPDSPLVVEVITGAGKHSAGGVAKVRPAIKAILQDRMAKFTAAATKAAKTAPNKEREAGQGGGQGQEGLSSIISTNDGGAFRVNLCSVASTLQAQVEPTSVTGAASGSKEQVPKSEPAASSTASSDPLAMGESIEARHGGGPKFYPGTVTAVHADDNTYDIAYADGDKESHVKRLRIRRSDEKQKRELAVGTVVEARYGGGQKMYDGVITASHGNDLFSISYADGDVETSVKRPFIEAQCQSKVAPVVSNVGTSGAEATVKPAVMTSKANPEGTAAVATTSPSAGPAASAQANASDPLSVGESIEARHGGGPKFYPGTVTAVHADDNTYDIAYADGDKESHVKRLRIRRAGEKQKRELAVGTVVEARFGGGQKMFDGVITASHGNDLFSISYADGDVETSVKRQLIEAQCAPKPLAVAAPATNAGTSVAEITARAEVKSAPPTSDSSPSANKTTAAAPTADSAAAETTAADDGLRGPGVELRVGLKVEARFGGKVQYYGGTLVEGPHGDDGSWSIAYDDGDHEPRVPVHLIAPRGEPGAFLVGESIEGRYGGKAKWFPGKVLADHGDGTFKVRYANDDGSSVEEEDREVFLRHRGSAAAAEADAARAAAAAAAAAKAKASAAKTTQGPFAKDASSDTFSAQGMEGIRRIFAHFDTNQQGLWPMAAWDAHQVALGEPAFSSEGHDLKALCDMLGLDPNVSLQRTPKGQDATNLDALIAYYQKEAGVLADDLATLKLLNPNGDGLLPGPTAVAPPTSSSSSLASTSSNSTMLAVGDVVEARYRGGPEYFPGKIAKATSAQASTTTASLPMYDIVFDDGDSESGLSALRVRRPGSKQKKELPVGARIEARFGGGQRLFSGVVAVAHGDGTFDLKYDDGDSEANVPRNLIMGEWH